MKLSIIIPTYNMEKSISNTLHSIINQSNTQFEILLIDDGSTDKTCLIAQETLECVGFEKFKIIKQKNGGVSSARNRGLSEAAGEYVVFFDGDDYVSKDFADTILNFAEENKPEVVCWGFDTLFENKSPAIKYFCKYKNEMTIMDGSQALYNIVVDKSMWIWTGSAAYKKGYLIENGLNYTVGCAVGEDLEFTYKVLSKAKKVVFIPKVLSYYIQRDVFTPNKYNIKKFDVIAAMDRTLEYIENIKTDNINIIRSVMANDVLIWHYLGNFNLCVMNLVADKIQRSTAIARVFCDIEENYPDLNKKMKMKMKGYRGKSKLLDIKIKAFLISPDLYFLLYRVNGVFKK